MELVKEKAQQLIYLTTSRISCLKLNAYLMNWLSIKFEQMHKKHSFSGNVLVKNKFAVTVYPRVDYAFIVALVVIPEEINEESKSNGSGGSDFGGASASAGGSCGGDAS